MIKNNLENCVTCVPNMSLLQRMRNRRKGLPNKINIPSAASASIDMLSKLQLPQLVIDWLCIALREGHIQPSQPTVGRLEGWPLRSYFKKSLYIDFECWCSKAGIPTYLIPSQSLFYQGTDAIFESLPNDQYLFPDLSICREKFSKLLKEANHDQSQTNCCQST